MIVKIIRNRVYRGGNGVDSGLASALLDKNSLRARFIRPLEEHDNVNAVSDQNVARAKVLRDIGCQKAVIVVQGAGFDGLPVADGAVKIGRRLFPRQRKSLSYIIAKMHPNCKREVVF